jgi:YHS domain-containing protein
MTRAGLVLLVLLLAAPGARAVEPEQCLLSPGQEPAVSVAHAGKTYSFALAECRDLFLSDPERYAQLFDALAELGPLPSEPESETVSLVPN